MINQYERLLAEYELMLIDHENCRRTMQRLENAKLDIIHKARVKLGRANLPSIPKR